MIVPSKIRGGPTNNVCFLLALVAVLSSCCNVVSVRLARRPVSSLGTLRLRMNKNELPPGVADRLVCTEKPDETICTGDVPLRSVVAVPEAVDSVLRADLTFDRLSGLRFALLRTECPTRERCQSILKSFLTSFSALYGKPNNACPRLIGGLARAHYWWESADGSELTVMLFGPETKGTWRVGAELWHPKSQP